MKCKHCDGVGFFGNGASQFKCVYCDGTGEVQTNEEWLRKASTEQLAEFLGNIAKNAYQCGQNGKTNKCVNRNHCTGYCDYGWDEWLKQPHTQGGAK